MMKRRNITIYDVVDVCSSVVVERNRTHRPGTTPSILDVLGGADVFQDNDDKANPMHENGVMAQNKKDRNGQEKADEIAAFHDFLYEPTEQTIQSRVRMLVSRGEAQAAEKLLLRSKVCSNNGNSIVLLLFMDACDSLIQSFWMLSMGASTPMPLPLKGRQI